VTAQGLGDDGVFSMFGDEHLGQNEVGAAGAKKNYSVKCHGQGGEMVLAHPGRNKRRQRQPKQEMKVRPQNAAVHKADRLEQVMMVVPINAEKNETQGVT